MKPKGAICLIGLGIGGTLIYQNIRNGNLKKWTKQINRTKIKMIDDLEEMM